MSVPGRRGSLEWGVYRGSTADPGFINWNYKRRGIIRRVICHATAIGEILQNNDDKKK
jgi:hypothetical protein